MFVVFVVSVCLNVVIFIVIVGVLFFLIGFFIWFNGLLIIFVKLVFEFSEVGVFLVLMVFYLFYFFLVLLVFWIFCCIGMKKGLSLSLLVMVGGVVLFGEFVIQCWYLGVFGGLFVIGSGLVLLQIVINFYIFIFGLIEIVVCCIVLMGICNKIVGMLVLVLIGILVLYGIGDLDKQVQVVDVVIKVVLFNEFVVKIYVLYLVMVVLLVVLVVVVLFLFLLEIKFFEVNVMLLGVLGIVECCSIFQFLYLWLGVLCLFVYVGVEVMVGDVIGIYGYGFGLLLDQIKMFILLMLGVMLVGYVVGLLVIFGLVLQLCYLIILVVMGVVFCLGVWVMYGYVLVGFVVLLGFVNVMMWLVIFLLVIRGLGCFIEIGLVLLVMGIVGGVIILQLFVVFKQYIDFQLVFVLLMVLCYLYILFYLVIGYCVGLLQDKV